MKYFISALLLSLSVFCNAQLYQAENYDAMSGVQVETTTDTGGGSNVGYLDPNDTLTYNVVVADTVSPKITFRVAGGESAPKFTVSENGKVLATVTVPLTGGWQNWISLDVPITLTKGHHTLVLTTIATAYNINWFYISSATVPLDLAPTLFTVPLTIQAEKYGGMYGVYNENTTDVGGGEDTGNIDTNDWMTYDNHILNVTTPGMYKVSYRVASITTGNKLELREASTDFLLNTITIPNTGGWQTWTTVESTIALTQGQHVFKIFGKVGGFNVNWFKIENNSATTTSSAVAVSSKSSVVSSSKASVASSSKSSVVASSVSSVASSTPSTSDCATQPSTSSAATNTVTTFTQPIIAKWDLPTQRENCQALAVSELYAYHIRAMDTKNVNVWESEPIVPGSTVTYTISVPAAVLATVNHFEIAVEDTNGLYSNFVRIEMPSQTASSSSVSVASSSQKSSSSSLASVSSKSSSASSISSLSSKASSSAVSSSVIKSSSSSSKISSSNSSSSKSSTSSSKASSSSSSRKFIAAPTAGSID